MLIRKLTVIVPVYNEACTVEQLLDRLTSVRFEIDREIIVVDDASTDGSVDVLRRLETLGQLRLVRHKINRGKGAAVRSGLAQASGQVVVVQDADLELDPQELPGLLEPILDGDTLVVYGSRFLNAKKKTLRWYPPYWANRLLNALSNRLNGLSITDFNTCYKMMTTQTMRRLDLTENGFAMEPEITAKLAKLGYRILEKPVGYRPRTQAGGKKIRASDLIHYLRAMFRYRFLWPADRTTEKSRNLLAERLLSG